MPLRSFAAVGNPTFSEYYQEAVRISPVAEQKEEERKLLTVAADGMPLREFVRLVAQRAEVSIVVEDELDERLVTLDVQEQGVADVLSSVARRLGVQVSRTGDLYFLGELRAEDKGVLVRRVGRLDSEQLIEAVKTLTSENGRVVSDVDGLLVVGDRVEVLRRVEELIGELEAAETRSWVVQLYVVGLSNRAVDEIGIDFAPAAQVALTYASAADPMAMLNLDAALSAILSYEQHNGGIATLAAPTFVVRDGVDGHTFVGERIPVPKRTVGISGDVSTTDFTEVEAGLDVVVTVRETGQKEAILGVEIDRSRINGFVEESPILRSEQFQTQAVVQSNGVYLLGELQRGDWESSQGGRFKVGTREVDELDRIQVWARTYAIAKPVFSSASGREEASPAAMSDKETSPPSGGSASGSSSVGGEINDQQWKAVQADEGPALLEPATGERVLSYKAGLPIWHALGGRENAGNNRTDGR